MAGEAVEKTLHDASSKKQVVKLADLIQVDPHLLHGAPFACSRNLLHIATMYGQADLVEEVLEINPQLARNLDSQKSSPLHIAAAKGNLEIAQNLLSKAPEMIWCCDGQGMNPVHVAAMNEQKQVLEVLIRDDYLPAMERLRHGQTVLHLCVKHRQLEAMKVLVDKLDQLHVEARDKDGYNILDSAVRSNQVDMIRYLVEDTKIKKETLNSMKKKALDILKQSPPHTSSSEIRKLLRGRIVFRLVTSEEIRQRSSALMIVAVLIATMAFQAVVSPPGGVWQDDTSSSRRAGHSVMATTHPKTYRVFLVANTLGFLLSLVNILMLITEWPSSILSLGLLVSYAVVLAEGSILVSYVASLIVITPTMERRFLGLLVGGIAFIVFTIYWWSIITWFLLRFFRKIKRSLDVVIYGEMYLQ